MIAENSNGDLNGKFVEYAPSGDIMTRGTHQGGVRTGKLETYDEFGGSIIGIVDSEGLLTGNNIAYVYPDGKTALLGLFEDSEIVQVQPAVIESPLDSEGMPTITFRKDFTDSVKCDVSSRDSISTQPLVTDVYESDRVHKKGSSICAAGEGLFAKVPLHKDEVVSFYNGIRLTHEEVDTRDWSLNGNTITLDEDTVLDVPNEFASVEEYCATLGHKANHSTTPNCKYDIFVHPRYNICTMNRCALNVTTLGTCMLLSVILSSFYIYSEELFGYKNIDVIIIPNTCFQASYSLSSGKTL